MNDIIYAGKHSLTHTVSRHAHASWELIYCTEGRGRLIFDGGEELAYFSGDIVVIPPHMPHENLSENGFTNIHLNLADCTLSFKTPQCFSDDSNAFLLQAFSAAYFHFYAPGERCLPLLSAYGNLIVTYLGTYQKTRKHSSLVEKIESEIIQNYSDCNYELNQSLRMLPFSSDYLRRLFRKEVGVTPHQYLMEKRLQTAAEYLHNMADSGNNIAEISRLCGFREPLYFSRMFKKKYGVSPSNFLKEDPPDGGDLRIPMEDV